MAKQKRNALDNLGSRLRELIEDIERLFKPAAPKRAPVPIPVRAPRDPYRR